MSFHEDIIKEPASTIHANPNFSCLQCTSEIFSCKLAALIRIENFWLILLQRDAQCVYKEGTLQANGELPGKHIPTVLVHNSHQIHKALWHGHISNIACPHLTRSINL